MASAPPGDDGAGQPRTGRKDVVREVDAILRRGRKLRTRRRSRAEWPDEADRVRSIVELRTSLFEEGMLDESATRTPNPSEPDALLEPAPIRDATTRSPTSSASSRTR